MNFGQIVWTDKQFVHPKKYSYYTLTWTQKILTVRRTDWKLDRQEIVI